MSPLIVDAISARSLPATVLVEADKLFIDYEAVAGGSGYVAPSVMLEFEARSTGEPASVRDISCDAAGLVDGIEFPTAKPRVMHAERTFWVQIPMKPPLCSEMIAPPDSGMISPP